MKIYYITTPMLGLGEGFVRVKLGLKNRGSPLFIGLPRDLC